MFESKNIYISKPYLVFHTYHLSILCLAHLFVFAKAYEVLSDSHKYFTFGCHIYYVISKWLS